jgi:hypothetical protein
MLFDSKKGGALLLMFDGKIPLAHKLLAFEKRS